MLSDMLFVTCACRYSIWMAILADNSYDIAVEYLASALLTLMLTGTLIYLVNVTDGTLHAPRPIQTRRALIGTIAMAPIAPTSLATVARSALLVIFISFPYGSLHAVETSSFSVVSEMSSNGLGHTFERDQAVVPYPNDICRTLRG